MKFLQPQRNVLDEKMQVEQGSWNPAADKIGVTCPYSENYRKKKSEILEEEFNPFQIGML